MPSITSLTYGERAARHTNPAAKALLETIERKKSNLCVSVDVSNKSTFLKIIDVVGPYASLIKVILILDSAKYSEQLNDTIRSLNSDPNQDTCRHSRRFWRRFSKATSRIEHKTRFLNIWGQEIRRHRLASSFPLPRDQTTLITSYYNLPSKFSNQGTPSSYNTQPECTKSHPGHISPTPTQSQVHQSSQV